MGAGAPATASLLCLLGAVSPRPQFHLYAHSLFLSLSLVSMVSLPLTFSLSFRLSVSSLTFCLSHTHPYHVLSQSFCFCPNLFLSDSQSLFLKSLSHSLSVCVFPSLSLSLPHSISSFFFSLSLYGPPHLLFPPLPGSPHFLSSSFSQFLFPSAGLSLSLPAAHAAVFPPNPRSPRPSWPSHHGLTPGSAAPTEEGRGCSPNSWVPSGLGQGGPGFHKGCG